MSGVIVKCTAVYLRQANRPEWVAVIKGGSMVRHYVLPHTNVTRQQAIESAQGIYPNADFSMVVGQLKLEVVK